MPTLDWIGKSRVVNHHLDVPYHVLERRYSFDAAGRHDEDNGSGNLIIHGDNLLALKSLLSQYEGRVKCIYIDPPYNTGKENWVYNDNVNDPRIKKWLGEVVGKEEKDLSRHDKWLCMMYPRLQLLHRLLAENGAIFVSINDVEIDSLKNILNEIFGRTNFIAIIPKKGSGGRQDSKHFAVIHEYVVCFAKNIEQYVSGRIVNKKISVSYPFLEESGKRYKTQLLRKWGDSSLREDRPNLYYPIYYNENSKEITVKRNHPEDIEIYPMIDAQTHGRWRWKRELMEAELLAGHVVVINKNGEYIAYEKIYEPEEDVETKPYDTWIDDIGTGKKTLKNIFHEDLFEYPKAVELIKRIINMSTPYDDDIILDSFAGSGTTAQAVLEMNKEDGGKRKFICIEMMDYADKLTAERVKRVIKGYKFEEDKEIIIYNKELSVSNLSEAPQMLEEAKEAQREAQQNKLYDNVGKLKVVDNCLRVVAKIKAEKEIIGTGGDFSFYELGEPLFHGEMLNEEVGEEEIRRYVYFMETREAPVSQEADDRAYLGTFLDVAYYFHYRRDAVTTLNRDFLRSVRHRAERYVVYADVCAISREELSRRHIVFKKIPRDIGRL